MYLPSKMNGRWSVETSGGWRGWDMDVSVCWDGVRLTFWEGGKPHYVSAASVNAGSVTFLGL